jgi:hypothetical protein
MWGGIWQERTNRKFGENKFASIISRTFDLYKAAKKKAQVTKILGGTCYTGLGNV